MFELPLSLPPEPETRRTPAPKLLLFLKLFLRLSLKLIEDDDALLVKFVPTILTLLLSRLNELSLLVPIPGLWAFASLFASRFADCKRSGLAGRA